MTGESSTIIHAVRNFNLQVVISQSVQLYMLLQLDACNAVVSKITTGESATTIHVVRNFSFVGNNFLIVDRCIYCYNQMFPGTCQAIQVRFARDMSWELFCCLQFCVGVQNINLTEWEQRFPCFYVHVHMYFVVVWCMMYVFAVTSKCLPETRYAKQLRQYKRCEHFWNIIYSILYINHGILYSTS